MHSDGDPPSLPGLSGQKLFDRVAREVDQREAADHRQQARQLTLPGRPLQAAELALHPDHPRPQIAILLLEVPIDTRHIHVSSTPPTGPRIGHAGLASELALGISASIDRRSLRGREMSARSAVWRPYRLLR